MRWLTRFVRVREHHSGVLTPPSAFELVAMTMLCTAAICATYFGLVPRNTAMLHARAGFFCPTTALDAALPLVPSLIWAYCAFYVVLPAIAVVTLFDRRVMYEGVVSYLVTGVLAFAVFFALPSRMPEPVDLATCASLSCRVLTGMQALDGGFNIFPSLHVAYSVVVWQAFRRYMPAAALPFGLLVIAIIASTVLLKRHALMDVPAGALLGVVAWRAGLLYGPRVAAWVPPVAPARADA